jgi:hypothetical protein
LILKNPFLLGLIVALAALWPAIAGPSPTTAPASAPASRPPGHWVPVAAARVAQAPQSQPAVTAAQVEAAAGALRARLDDSFVVLTHGPFVVAGNLPPEELREYVQGSLIAPAQAMYANYFDARPACIITVLLFADEGSYLEWQKRLFGRWNISNVGYYRIKDHTLVMNMATGSSTLVHELTHALNKSDWPDAPRWFAEGLATLHEGSQVRGNEIIPQPDERLPDLQDAILRNKLAPLAKLPYGDFFHDRTAHMNYAQASYFCYFLQHRGLLRQFYRRYRAADASGEDLNQVVRAVCGCNLAQTDQEMRRWVMTLKWP